MPVMIIEQKTNVKIRNRKQNVDIRKYIVLSGNLKVESRKQKVDSRKQKVKS